MKALLFLAFFSAIFDCDANPFTDGNVHLHGVFRHQKDYLEEIIYIMDVYSQSLANNLMEIVTSEIAGWQRRGKTCRDNIFRPRNTEEIGEQLSICAFGVADHLFTVQSLILYAVEEAQVETHAIQQTLLRELQREDILEVSEDFYDYAVEIGDQIMQRFYDERHPVLIATLDGMYWSMENLPGLLQDCINAITRKFTIFC